MYNVLFHARHRGVRHYLSRTSRSQTLLMPNIRTPRSQTLPKHYTVESDIASAGHRGVRHCLCRTPRSQTLPQQDTAESNISSKHKPNPNLFSLLIRGPDGLASCKKWSLKIVRHSPPKHNKTKSSLAGHPCSKSLCIFPFLNCFDKFSSLNRTWGFL